VTAELELEVGNNEQFRWPKISVFEGLESRKLGEHRSYPQKLHLCALSTVFVPDRTRRVVAFTIIQAFYCKFEQIKID